jgi:hypothetical protein
MIEEGVFFFFGKFGIHYIFEDDSHLMNQGHKDPPTKKTHGYKVPSKNSR